MVASLACCLFYCFLSTCVSSSLRARVLRLEAEQSAAASAATDKSRSSSCFVDGDDSPLTRLTHLEVSLEDLYQKNVSLTHSLNQCNEENAALQREMERVLQHSTRDQQRLCQTAKELNECKQKYQQVQLKQRMEESKQILERIAQKQKETKNNEANNNHQAQTQSNPFSFPNALSSSSSSSSTYRSAPPSSSPLRSSSSSAFGLAPLSSPSSAAAADADDDDADVASLRAKNGEDVSAWKLTTQLLTKELKEGE